MKAERSVSKTGSGNNWAPNTIVRIAETRRIGSADLSKIAEFAKVRSLSSPPPIGVASGILVISRRATVVHNYGNASVKKHTHIVGGLRKKTQKGGLGRRVGQHGD